MAQSRRYQDPQAAIRENLPPFVNAVIRVFARLFINHAVNVAHFFFQPTGKLQPARVEGRPVPVFLIPGTTAVERYALK